MMDLPALFEKVSYPRHPGIGKRPDVSRRRLFAEFASADGQRHWCRQGVLSMRNIIPVEINVMTDRALYLTCMGERLCERYTWDRGF